MNAPPFLGLVSSLGIVLWTVSATVCVFGWSVLRSQPAQQRVFLLYFGVLTTSLFLDDLFLLHEEIFAYQLRIPQKVTLAGHVGVTLFGLLTFQRAIRNTQYWKLLVALVFLGISVGIDVNANDIERVLGRWRVLLEDGAKFLGITSWLAYWVETCFAAVQRALLRENPNDKSQDVVECSDS